MDWDALLLIIIGAYTTVKTSRLAYQMQSFKYLSYALAILFLSMGQGGIVLEPVLSSYDLFSNTALFVEITVVSAVAFALCGLAIFVRESEPVFAQFPLIYAAAPLLLVISHWFVKDSFAIKEWLLSIYQGGALLVAIMIYGARSIRSSEVAYFKYMLAVTVLFLIAYVLYWFIPGMKADNMWIWNLCLGLGLIVLVRAFNLPFINSFSSD